jgi:hypothetical protein
VTASGSATASTNAQGVVNIDVDIDAGSGDVTTAQFNAANVAHTNNTENAHNTNATQAAQILSLQSGQQLSFNTNAALLAAVAALQSYDTTLLGFIQNDRDTNANQASLIISLQAGQQLSFNTNATLLAAVSALQSYDTTLLGFIQNDRDTNATQASLIASLQTAQQLNFNTNATLLAAVAALQSYDVTLLGFIQNDRDTNASQAVSIAANAAAILLAGNTNATQTAAITSLQAAQQLNFNTNATLLAAVAALQSYDITLLSFIQNDRDTNAAQAVSIAALVTGLQLAHDTNAAQKVILDDHETRIDALEAGGITQNTNTLPVFRATNIVAEFAFFDEFYTDIFSVTGSVYVGGPWTNGGPTYLTNLSGTGPNLHVDAAGLLSRTNITGGSSSFSGNAQDLIVTNTFRLLTKEVIATTTNTIIDFSTNQHVRLLLLTNTSLIFTNVADGLSLADLKVQQDTNGGWAITRASVAGGSVITNGNLWGHLDTNASALTRFDVVSHYSTNLLIFLRATYSDLVTATQQLAAVTQPLDADLTALAGTGAVTNQQTNTLTLNGTVGIKAGQSVSNFYPGGIFFSDQTHYTNWASATLTNMATVLVPANMLTNNGDTAVLRWDGQHRIDFAATQRLAIVSGALTVFDSGLQISSNRAWTAELTLRRLSATTIQAATTLVWPGTTVSAVAVTNSYTVLALATGTNNIFAIQAASLRPSSTTNTSVFAEYKPVPRP